MADPALIATIGANTQPFEAGMQRARGETAKTKSSFDQLKQTNEKLSAAMNLARGGAVAAGFAALVGVIAKARATISNAADAARELGDGATFAQRRAIALDDTITAMGRDSSRAFSSLVGGAVMLAEKLGLIDLSGAMEENARKAGAAMSALWRKQTADAAKAQYDARKKAIEKADADEAKLQQNLVAEREKLEADLADKRMTDAEKVAKLEREIATLRRMEKKGGLELIAGNARRKAELALIEIVEARRKSAQDKLNEDRAKAQQDYIAAEDALANARLSAEKAITAEVQSRAAAIAGESQKTGREKRAEARVAAKFAEEERRARTQQSQEAENRRIADAYGPNAAKVKAAQMRAGKDTEEPSAVKAARVLADEQQLREDRTKQLRSLAERGIKGSDRTMGAIRTAAEDSAGLKELSIKFGNVDKTLTQILGELRVVAAPAGSQGAR